MTLLRQWTWNASKKLTFPVHKPNAIVTCLLISRQRIISAFNHHTIQVHDPATGSWLSNLQGHGGGVWTLEICSRRIDNPRLSCSIPQYYDVLVDQK
jgi:F-box and WD-40 domain protein CDC4